MLFRNKMVLKFCFFFFYNTIKHQYFLTVNLQKTEGFFFKLLEYIFNDNLEVQNTPLLKNLPRYLKRIHPSYVFLVPHSKELWFVKRILLSSNTSAMPGWDVSFSHFSIIDSIVLFVLYCIIRIQLYYLQFLNGVTS